MSFLIEDEAFTRNHLVISMHQPVGQEVIEMRYGLCSYRMRRN